MKAIKDYSTLVHYGCSMAAGFDSAGDNIHDRSMSYPEHLSRIMQNNVINKSLFGSSNDLSYAFLCADILNNSIPSDSVVIFNLTKAHRTQYIFAPDQKQEWSGIPVFYIPEEKISFLPLPSPEGQDLEKYAQEFKILYMQQHNYVFYMNMIKNITSANELCKQHAIPIAIVDLYGDLNFLTMHKNNKILEMDNLFTGYKSIIGMLRDTSNLNDYTSANLHYYNEGYKLIAQDVYNRIGNYIC